MSLGGLLKVIGELRCTKPFLFALDLSIRCCPADLATECLKVALGLFPLFLLQFGLFPQIR
jgi:hypothetical protein